jgi:PTH2 family peptidyl-tRNA hydrolase
MEPKQVIVMRKDLGMRKGKMIAQGAHAAMSVVIAEYDKGYTFSGPLLEWLDGKFIKICVSVNSENELRQIYEKAKAAGVFCSLIEDAGLTEFNGVPTLTCAAIGPDYPENIDPITGHLPLL